MVAALTHIRSRPWLEQMVARATRIDPNAGPYDTQRALVFHPDDPLFARFRKRIETEQGTLARQPKPRKQGHLPLWLQDLRAEQAEEHGIVPLESNALAMRYELLKPGPDLSLHPAEPDPQGRLLEPPSQAERRLRLRVGEMVAAQVIEDEGALLTTKGEGAYHRYNAVLKRVLGKSRAAMTLPELEAALGWLERNRLQDSVHLLDGDARYAWTARQRGQWRPRSGGPVQRSTRVRDIF